MTSPLQISVEPDGTEWLVLMRPADAEVSHNEMIQAGIASKVDAEELARSWRSAIGGELVESGFNTCLVHGMFGRVGARCDPDSSAERAAEPCQFVPLCYRKPTDQTESEPRNG